MSRGHLVGGHVDQTIPNKKMRLGKGPESTTIAPDSGSLSQLVFDDHSINDRKTESNH